MSVKRGVFQASDLVRVTEPHTGAWKCIACPAVLVLDDSDQRAHERSVPRCVECGALTAAYGPVTRGVN